MVERFKVIRELKNKHPIIWTKLSHNEDYDEDFRRDIQNFFFSLQQQLAMSKGDPANFYNNLRILKYLIPLDPYFTDDPNHRTFAPKYEDYYQKLCDFS
jgi:hypothetical protein